MAANAIAALEQKRRHVEMVKHRNNFKKHNFIWNFVEVFARKKAIKSKQTQSVNKKIIEKLQHKLQKIKQIQ